MKKYKKRIDSYSLRMKIATNLVLSVLVFSIGALCLSTDKADISAVGNETEVYRSAGEEGIGVSLTFNVYWGTNELYRILQTLKKYDAKATFFIGGCWADDNVECLKSIYENGHEIGNHGYFHKDHTKLNLLNNKKEISDCREKCEQEKSDCK